MHADCGGRLFQARRILLPQPSQVFM